MLEMLKNFSFVLSLLLLSSCGSGKSKKTNVTSGTSQIQKTIFSKKCASGSFQILKRTTSVLGANGQPVASSASVSGLAILQAGDKVSIQGRVVDASPCYQGPVSFSCEAQLAIPNNRSFICQKGSVGAGAYTSQTGVYPQTGVYSSAGRSFVSGEFHTFGNGQQVFGRIVVGSSSNLVPQATCIMGFSCL